MNHMASVNYYKDNLQLSKGKIVRYQDHNAYTAEMKKYKSLQPSRKVMINLYFYAYVLHKR